MRFEVKGVARVEVEEEEVYEKGGEGEKRSERRKGGVEERDGGEEGETGEGDGGKRKGDERVEEVEGREEEEGEGSE